MVEDVRFDNWTMESVGEGIVVTSHYIMGGETASPVEPFSERTPVFRNIAISHVTVSGAKRKAIDIDGLPEMPIMTLRLTDILGYGQAGLTARYTDGLELHGVQLNAGRGSAFTIENASNIELDGLTSRKPVAGMPVLRLTRSPGAIVRNCRAFPGTETFLSTGRGELKSILLEGNLLQLARTATEEQ